MSPSTYARTLAVLVLAAASFAAGSASAFTLYAVGGNAGPSGGQTGLYTVDATTGVMTWVGSPHTAGSFDNTIYNGGLAYDPSADRMYALGCDSSSASALFRIDRADASMIRIGYCDAVHPGAFCSGGLAFDVTSGRLFALGDLGAGQATWLVEIDTNTGAATAIGVNGPPGTYLAGLGCDPRTGVLYANGFRDFVQTSALFVVDKASGSASFVGSHGLTLGRQMNYSGLAVHPVTGALLGFGSTSASQNSLYSVSASSGTATFVAPESPNGVGVDGALVYAGTDILGAPPEPAAGHAMRAWPNPARAGVTFAFGLERPGAVSLALFDLAGRRVFARAAEPLGAGAHSLTWDGSDERGDRVAPGLYFATLRSGGVVTSRASVWVAR